MPHSSSSFQLLTALKFSLEHHHYIAFININCALSQFMGLKVETRIEIIYKDRSLIATLIALPASLINCGEIGISESAWVKLRLKEGDKIKVKLAEPLESFSFVKSKAYGHPFTKDALQPILTDISHRKYSDTQLACFL